jgi:hypothetical protein
MLKFYTISPKIYKFECSKESKFYPKFDFSESAKMALCCVLDYNTLAY